MDDGQSVKLPDAIVPQDNRHSRSLLRKHWHNSVEFFLELVTLVKTERARQKFGDDTVKFRQWSTDNARNFKLDNGAHRILANDFATLHS